MTVLLVGTLDTKGSEIQFARDRLRAAGMEVTVLDGGIIGMPGFAAEITREQVFEAAGSSLETVCNQADRGKAIEIAARGVTIWATRLWAQGQVLGILGLGGSAGTTIATAAMRALPFGVPKLMLSTVASGQVRPYVGVRDISMMHSVVDLCGLNWVSRSVLERAVDAIVGMIKGASAVDPALREASQQMQHALPEGTHTAEHSLLGGERNTKRGGGQFVVATMFGVTTPCVEAARKEVEASGHEVLVFHATGIGGMTMESFIADGLVSGVLDLTTTELADQLVGGELSAGPDRLTAAALRGVAQVVSLGALDMVNFGTPASVPERFKGRRFYQHNPNVTLMRTTPEENDRLGREIAEKTSAARGPTAVLIPKRGVSAIDREGQPFWWPEADEALFQSVRNSIAPQVTLLELDCHINDPQFATTAAKLLLEMMI